jgi:adenylylsulfate kinase
MVIWLTGLSGAGKSTLARLVVERLRRDGEATVLLDGDEVRAAVGDEATGYDPDGRLKNAYRMSRLACMLEGQGLTVVVATMSLFHEIHEYNRRHFAEYREVLLRVGRATAERRDPKGLYRRVAERTEKNLAGIDIAAELPRDPHLVIDNDADHPDYASLVEAVLGAAGRA